MGMAVDYSICSLRRYSFVVKKKSKMISRRRIICILLLASYILFVLFDTVIGQAP